MAREGQIAVRVGRDRPPRQPGESKLVTEYFASTRDANELYRVSTNVETGRLKQARSTARPESRCRRPPRFCRAGDGRHAPHYGVAEHRGEIPRPLACHV